MGRAWGRRRRIGGPQLGVLVVSVLLLLWSGVGAAIPSPVAVPKPVVHSVPAAPPAVTAPPLSCAQKPCMALTFDDGPDANITPVVLDVLDKYRARATFFVVGAHVRGNEALLQRMHKSGHEIGNHSWGHPDMTALNPEQIHHEVYSTQAAITAAGVPAPRLFRPPYGAVNQYVDSHVPLTIVQWNIDPEDWRSRKHAHHIIEHMGAYAKPGGVVVMHDTQTRTVEALDPMLSDMQTRYQFVTVSELLHLVPGQPGMYYGH